MMRLAGPTTCRTSSSLAPARCRRCLPIRRLRYGDTLRYLSSLQPDSCYKCTGCPPDKHVELISLSQRSHCPFASCTAAPLQAAAACERHPLLASVVQRYGHMYYHFVMETLPR